MESIHLISASLQRSSSMLTLASCHPTRDMTHSASFSTFTLVRRNDRPQAGALKQPRFGVFTTADTCAEQSNPSPAPPLVNAADRVKAAGISCVVVGEALIREEDPAKAAEALLL